MVEPDRDDLAALDRVDVDTPSSCTWDIRAMARTHRANRLRACLRGIDPVLQAADPGDPLALSIRSHLDRCRGDWRR